MLWHVVETQLCQIIRSSIMLNVRAWIQWFMQTLVSAHFTFFHIDAVKIRRRSDRFVPIAWIFFLLASKRMRKNEVLCFNVWYNKLLSTLNAFKCGIYYSGIDTPTAHTQHTQHKNACLHWERTVACRFQHPQFRGFWENERGFITQTSKAVKRNARRQQRILWL